MTASFRRGLTDLHQTFRQISVIFYFNWTDTKARYIRSFLGPLWLVAGTAIGIGGLAALWTSLLGMDPHTYVPSLATGLVLWLWIAACVSEAPGVLIRKGNVIRNMTMPITFFCLSSVTGHAITFLHNLLVVVLILLLFPHAVAPADIGLSLLGLLLTLINLIWLSTLLALVGARFRDLEPAVAAVLPLLFLLSPVLFQIRQLPFDPLILWLNPATYAITAIRDPLLGAAPAAGVYLTLAAAAAAGWLCTVHAIGRYGKRVAYWV